MKPDLIVFGEDWGGLPSSTQHLIKQLSLTRKVVWVNSIGLRQPRFSIHDIKRVWRKLTQKRAVQAHNENEAPFTTVNIKTIPAPKGTFARWVAKKLIINQLKPILQKEKLNQPILWTSLPTVADVCGELGEKSVVYYCGDDFGALAGVDHSTVIQHEQKLIDKADLILAASKKLLVKFPKGKTQLLTHGVDFTLFNQPVPRAKDLPNDGRPIAGFYGSLSDWLDYDLLNQVIADNPLWHFVFIGKNELTYNQFKNHPNLHLLGPKMHYHLPRYSQHWQANLLPFVDNEQIRACNPLKLLEYLATGTPIISTSFPALAPYIAEIHTVNSTQDFTTHLNNIYSNWLNSSVNNKNTQQAALTKKHTWQAKAQQLDVWLEAL
ncbi:glycosyl transferase [Aliivibrio fischeri]|uniref:glycosyltransferase n=1 Tax=Aliivibrio fischeri TaxID=668 RepID=UPI00084CD845|nr:glycosyltransferase [Aliivibrio fischeri]OED56072.1 glycosyl transferase [Aliivibrio fischeri]